MILMKDDLANQIKSVIDNWRDALQSQVDRKDIIAINFGIQKVIDGFELYLSGHKWFDGHDLWLLDKYWTPSKNFITLGKYTSNYERLLVLETLEKVIVDELKQHIKVYDNVIVTVGLADSVYKRLK